MKNYILTISILFSVFSVQAQKSEPINATLSIPGEPSIISRHIYGHFSEHLGHCIYGGYWVGTDSDIPNTNGIRNDVVEALKKIEIPNLRWPGGCFADEYHWMDGIGPAEERPKMVNTHWGGVTEDNSFGTHEFLELCRQLGTEPVICGNVGSGTVQEMSQWVEYLNFDGISPMADLRKENGRDEPWGVKFWGVGNENWGCGGSMTPEFYADQYRRYATFTRNYGDNRLLKIAGGANSTDYRWTEVLMKNIPHRMMYGISLHYYTTNWSKKGSATQFGEDLYFDVLRRCQEVETAIDKHIAIMDKYDPQKRVALIFDEWGTWYDVEPGTNPGFLFQQNTVRDALVAGLTLNYLNKKCDRVKMANIAQTINVLQALIFTDGEKMMLTPTYHVFAMYKVHHDAELLPVSFESPKYTFGDQSIDAVSISASRDKEGVTHFTLVNIDPVREQTIHLETGLEGKLKAVATLLTGEAMNSHNTFDNPGNVVPVDYNKARFKDGKLSVELPPMSVILVSLEK